MITPALALGIVLLDQFTKHLALQHFVLGQAQTVIPGFFNLTHVRNTGAVWGSLQHHNAWLVVFSIVSLVFIGCMHRWLVDARGVNRATLGLMIGGVIGNLIDRIRLGWVVDFLDFYWRGNHWPAFNVADAAICLGVAGYIFSAWRTARKS